MAGLILEGVTGAGKSQVLRLLLQHPLVRKFLEEGRVFWEDETFDDLMSELRDPTITETRHCARLRRVMQTLAAEKLARGDRYVYLLERFHPSYYAFMPRWKLYDNIDAGLERLSGLIVLLRYPPEQIVQRALGPRPGDEHDRGRALAQYYGSRHLAVEAVAHSQERRLEFLNLTRLPHLVIDTAAMDWPAYAEEITRFWLRGA